MRKFLKSAALFPLKLVNGLLNYLTEAFFEGPHLKKA